MHLHDACRVASDFFVEWPVNLAQQLVVVTGELRGDEVDEGSPKE